MNSLQVGQWAGRVALVTGAGSGIGAAVARKLAGLGVKRLILADIDRKAAERVAATIANTQAAEVEVADEGECATARVGATLANARVAGVDVAEEGEVDRRAAERVADVLANARVAEVSVADERQAALGVADMRANAHSAEADAANEGEGHRPVTRHVATTQVAEVDAAGEGQGDWRAVNRVAGVRVGELGVADEGEVDRRGAERDAGALAGARVGEPDVADEGEVDRSAVKRVAGAPVNARVGELGVADKGEVGRRGAERVAGAVAGVRVGELGVAERGEVGPRGTEWAVGALVNARVEVADEGPGDRRVMERVGRVMPNIQVVEVDVADEEQVERVIAEIDREHGLDVVVHAAGVDDPAAKQRIADAMAAGRPPEVTAWLESPAWRRVMSVNLDGTFHVLRAAVRRMVPKREGVIVVVGSSSAFDAPAGYPHYSASKAGVHALAQAVAKEVIPFGVRVNVVAPGPTDTGMAARTPDLLRQAFTGPGARPYATPEEIADVAMFLAGRESANLAGAVLLANGGRFTV